MALKNPFFYLIAISFLGYNTLAQTSLDKLLDRHFNAMGQPSLESIRSLKMNITEVDGFGSGSKYEVIKKRPYRIRKEGEDTGEHFILAADGQVAWEHRMERTPSLLDSSWIHKLKVDAIIGSPLALGGKPGHSIQLIGNGSIEGKSNYIVRMYFPDYSFMDFYIDKRDYLLKKLVTYRDFFQEVIDVQIYFDGYRRLGPYLFSYKQQRQLTVDSPVVDIIVGEIVVGVGADNSIFRFPEQ